MRAATQIEAWFGGAFFIEPSMGTIRLHPMLARVYLLGPDFPLDLHVPIGEEPKMLGPMFWVFNEGPADVQIVNDLDGDALMGTIRAAHVGICVKLHTGSIATVPPGPGPTVHPWTVIERPSF